VTGSVEQYVSNLERTLPKDDDVVGYAVAVNGKVESVEVFASPRLFGKMKGKLLKASATEALAAKTDAPSSAPSPEVVRAFIADAESGAAKTEKRTLRTQVTRKENQRNVLFETADPIVPSKPVHKSYLAK
jgi:hypothetical protein